jgi:hypothetical protein
MDEIAESPSPLQKALQLCIVRASEGASGLHLANAAQTPRPRQIMGSSITKLVVGASELK